MRLKPIDRKAASSLDSSWTKNISLDLLHNKSHRFSYIAIVCIFVFILIFNFFLFTNNNGKIISRHDESKLLENSLNTRDAIQNYLNREMDSLNKTGSFVDQIEDENNEKQLLLLKSACINNNFSSIWISKSDGNCYFDDGSIGNISNAEYFTTALNGKPSIIANQPHPITGEQSVIFSTPILKENKITGVISATMSLTELTKIVSSFNLYNDSFSFIVKNDGELVSKTTAFHSNQYTNLYAYLQKQKVDPYPLASCLYAGETGTQLLKYQSGESVFYSFVPFDQIKNWVFVNIVPENKTLVVSKKITQNTITFVAIVAIILTVVFAYVYYLKRSSQKTFQYLAYTDQLTGCCSWVKFAIDSKEILKKCKDKQYTYIYSNIVNFKYVNDIMDFSVGNQLLQHISRTLEMNLNADEPYTRVNADRFSFLMEYCDDDTTIRRLKKISKQVNDFQATYKLNFLNRMEFGIYKIKDTTLPITTMNDRALLAMQSIHSTKEAFYSFYNSKIRETALQQKEFESEMENALEQKQFVIYLQPKFSLNNNHIIGAEALVRWKHPQRGLIPPNSFIGLFESNGFISKLDYYVFEETCRLLHKWIKNGMTPVPISVNMSRMHIYNPHFAQELYTIVEKYNIPIELIEIELTETMNLENISTLLNAVNSLKQYHFVLSIDDFGTGYSSLNLLKNLPVDILKIDREFFSKASDETRGRQVIASIIDMAKRLDMKTVAEGVELQEQADFLSSVNCDFVQGYFFSKPISISNFEDSYIHKTK